MALRVRILLPIAVFIAAAGVGLWAGPPWFGPTPAERRAALQQRVEATILPRDYARVPDLALETADGSALNEVLDDRWSLLFLGFTHCPDVCPLTLQAVAAATEQLSPETDPRLQVAFVSVDPRRDDPAGTERYAREFDPAFIGATGSPPALRRLADRLHVDFRVPDAAPDADYSVEHPSTVFLLDPERRLRALFSAPHGPAVMARDLETIVQAAGKT